MTVDQSKPTPEKMGAGAPNHTELTASSQSNPSSSSSSSQQAASSDEKKLMEAVKDVVGAEISPVSILTTMRSLKLITCSPWSVQAVVNALFDNPQPSPVAATVTSSSTSGFGSGNGGVASVSPTKSKGGFSSPPLVDLTKEEENIQKALVDSLQQTRTTTTLSKEEEDIGRAIELSMKVGAVDVVFRDPVDPRERQRSPELWPVGLKNLGSTCWFNVVIQALFHLPSFRNQVLHCPVAKQQKEEDIADVVPSPSLHFMQELQKLFAFLLCSKRKYANPSKVVDLFREQVNLPQNEEGFLGSAQQDVSEVTHGLLGLLEAGFKEALEEDVESNGDLNRLPSDLETPAPSSSLAQSQNPVHALFFGQTKRFQTEQEGEAVGVSEESFSLLPLAVDGFQTLEEAIEDSLLSHEASETHNFTELWFSTLPPVLLFDLQRFSFCKKENRTEKIHNRLSFSPDLNMDRFLDTNRELVREKRKQMSQLKARLKTLRRNLEKYDNYGSEKHQMPLSEILNASIEFVSGKRPAETCADILSVAQACVSSDIQDSRPPSLPPNDDPMDTDPAAEGLSRTSTPRLERMDCSVPSTETDDACPRPSHVSEEERRVVVECFTRLKNEVETSVTGLEAQVEGVEAELASVFEGLEWKQHPYKLFAVLVHEGQVNSGHYWAFIYNPVDEKWKKFNDVRVSSTTWSTVGAESFGGTHYASAYNLVYVDANRADSLFQGFAQLSTDELLDSLPKELKGLVEADNEAFEGELKQWEEIRAPEPPSTPSAPVEDFSKKNYEISSIASSSYDLLKKLMESAENAECNLEKEMETLEEHLRVGAEKFNAWGQTGGQLPGLVDPRLRHVYAFAAAFGLVQEPAIRSHLLLQPFLLALHKEPESNQKNELLASATALLKTADLNDSDQEKLNKIHLKFDKFRQAAMVLAKLIMERPKDAESTMKFLLVLRTYLPSEETERFLYPKLCTNLALKTLYEVNKRDAGRFPEMSSEDRKRLHQEYQSLTFPLLQLILLGDAPHSRPVYDAIQKLWGSLLDPVWEMQNQNLSELNDMISAIIDEESLKLRPFNFSKFNAKVHLSPHSAREVATALTKAIQLGLCDDELIRSLLEEHR